MIKIDIDFNLNVLLKFFFSLSKKIIFLLPILANNNQVLKIYCENIAIVFPSFFPSFFLLHTCTLILFFFPFFPLFFPITSSKLQNAPQSSPSSFFFIFLFFYFFLFFFYLSTSSVTPTHFFTLIFFILFFFSKFNHSQMR